MASRYRSLSRPAFTLIKSTLTKPTATPKPSPSLLNTSTSSSSSAALSRSVSRLGCVQSLLPLHSAVSSARLTSCLGVDSRSSRSLSQEMGLGTPR
ncbi:protein NONRESPONDING TO OXYLIPINS 2, mitochondrial isoform X2 [Arachis stenosperma]|uniref:protein NONRESPONDING TO OXYLIPINS 2, mitochondrial isoform X1 n=1 Tax=Arachis hypogaea TaxID=3818 RepID=UPI000DEDCFF6|nr:uncharacterized protein LOC112784786 isoform X2 [Arachis hypogaea]XP_057739324.1 protein NONRESPONDING TO OXYLIPINS 2, mitochondrial isoform X2 [Arachis stenosperma]